MKSYYCDWFESNIWFDDNQLETLYKALEQLDHEGGYQNTLDQHLDSWTCGPCRYQTPAGQAYPIKIDFASGWTMLLASPTTRPEKWPDARITFTGVPCMASHGDLWAIMAAIRKDLASLPAHLTVRLNRPSRVDLCTDLFLPVTPIVQDALQFKFKSRCETWHPYFKRYVSSGLRFGKSGITARIYDKHLQLKSKTPHYRATALSYLEPRWGTQPEHVTRIEFQLNTLALRSFQIREFEDLHESLDRLWAYMIRDWLVFTKTTNAHDHNQGRLQVADYWPKPHKCLRKVVRRHISAVRNAFLIDRSAALAVAKTLAAARWTGETIPDHAQGWLDEHPEWYEYTWERANSALQRWTQLDDNPWPDLQIPDPLRMRG